MRVDGDCFNDLEKKFSDPDNDELWDLREDDFLFGEGEESHWDMQLDAAHGGWHQHVWAYKSAADNLVSLLICGPSWMKVFIDVYPVMALYRHYVEIAIKELIVNAAEFKRVSLPNLLSHDLNSLWPKVVEMLKDGEADDSSIQWDLIGVYVGKVNKIPYDLGRYPWTRDVEDVHLPDDVINLVQLRLFMNRVGNHLEMIANWLIELRSHRDL